MHPTNNRIIALKSLKYKKFAKGCHRQASGQSNATASATQNTIPHRKNSTTFFETSYQQYLRQNHGLSVLEGAAHREGAAQATQQTVQPHMVMGANTNYIAVDDALHDTDVYPHTAANVPTPNNNSATAPGHNYMTSHHYSNDITINQTLRYYSTVAPTPSGQNTMAAAAAAAAAANNNSAPKEAMLTATPHDEYAQAWPEDTEENLNPETYLRTHIEQINTCYSTKQYARIHALYQSLKRNGLTVPLDTYEKIIDSFARRAFDSNNRNLDEKMFSLLNCYHDIVNSKLKPSTRIYNTVLLQIFRNSIVAFEANNQNGLDFFKIGSQLFHTVIKNNRLKSEVINHYLLALNIYSGAPFKYFSMNEQQNSTALVPNLDAFKATVINGCATFKKDSFYFISLINLAKITNNLPFLKELYQEFLLLLPLDTSITLKSDQFEIYSMFITGFLETGELKLSSKIFENVINEIKLKNGMSDNIQLVLSNYLISLSKMDAQKAYSLWSNFKKLSWVPEFSYDFYLQMMANSFHDWTLTKKIYEYIFPMDRVFHNKARLTTTTSEINLSSYLLYPIHTEVILNSLMNYAIQLNDQEVVFKLLEESQIKEFAFDINLYPYIFNFMSETNCSSAYMQRVIEKHGDMIVADNVEKHNYVNMLMFLTAITDASRNSEVLESIVNMKFFSTICKNVEFTPENINNQAPLYNGLRVLLDEMWRLPKRVETYPLFLEIQASLIIRLFDFDTYVPTEENKFTSNSEFDAFKTGLLERFETMATNFNRLSLDPNSVSHTVSQAVRLTAVPEEVIDYFSNPGDWDKSYPLSLGSQIRNAPATGIQEFENLSRDGYCFDYDTYKELIRHRHINEEIIAKSFGFVSQGDTDGMKYLANLLVGHIPAGKIEKFFFSSKKKQLISSFDSSYNFQKSILPYLKDSSLTKIIKNLKSSTIISQLLPMLKFPDNFKSITVQAEFKQSIDLLYEKLFEGREYESIVEFNELCPVLNLNILLKSCIRAGDEQLYLSLLSKFRSSLTPETLLEVQCEYLLDHLKFQEVIKECKKADGSIESSKSGDYYSFAVFLKSFFNNSVDIGRIPENTLQFANNLSSFNNFAEAMAYYNQNAHLLGHPLTKIESQKIDSIIIEQMINNLVDASHLILNNHNTEGLTFDQVDVVNKFQQKLKTFFHFKAFLKSQSFSLSGIQKLIDVWQNVEPYSIDAFFNNLIETIYLKPDTLSNTLMLTNDLTWNFNRGTLRQVLASITKVYETQGDLTKIDKAQQFNTFITQQSH